MEVLEQSRIALRVSRLHRPTERSRGRLFCLSFHVIGSSVPNCSTAVSFGFATPHRMQ
jgi:hypothetical protein